LHFKLNAMTVSKAREKLHDLIDHADEVKIFELLSLFEGTQANRAGFYDESTILMLQERSAEYLSGKSKTYSPEESLKRINSHRGKHGDI